MMNLKQRSFLALTLLGVVLATSCFGGTREAPKKRYFALRVDAATGSDAASGAVREPAHDATRAPVPNTTRAHVHDATLAVRRARASVRFEGRGLVYRRGEAEYQSDFYNEFLVSPSAQLTEETRRSLADAGVFRHVVDAGSAAPADYLLEMVINDLHGDFRDASQPKAVLDIEFFLLRAKGDVVLAQWPHRAEIAIDRAAASELVLGWNRALREVLARLAGELRTVELEPG